MPNTRAARNEMRVAERRRIRHKSVRSLPRTDITKAEKLIFAGELESAQKAVIEAIKSLDEAAKKGVIHPNNAARRKSRLMKKLNQALVLPTAEPETEEIKVEKTKARKPKAEAAKVEAEAAEAEEEKAD